MSLHRDFGGEFEFRVVFRDWPGGSDWHVELPHQCETWDITHAPYGDIGDGDGSYGEARAALARFVEEASTALKAMGDLAEDEFRGAMYDPFAKNEAV